ncbi:MAG: helicase HerA domain-containing protein, partial [Candidatus Hodarchaeales archaeon]
IGIAGDMGTGKTSLVKSLAANMVLHHKMNYEQRKVGLIIFDYKGDLAGNDFRTITEAKVLNLKKNPLPYNLMEINPSQTKQVIEKANILYDILSKLYSKLGPKQEASFKKAVHKAYEIRGITDDDPASYKNTLPTIYDIEKQVIEAYGEKKDSLTGLLENITSWGLFERDPEKCRSIDELCHQTTVFQLNTLGTQTSLQELTITIILNLLYNTMIKLDDGSLFGPAGKEYREIRTLVIIDEADNFISKDFNFTRDLLVRGRSKGFGFILSTQYLKNYKDYKDYIRTWFLYQLPNVKPAELDSIGVDKKLNEYIRKLEKYHSVMKGDLEYSKQLLSRKGKYNEVYLRITPFHELIRDHKY